MNQSMQQETLDTAAELRLRPTLIIGLGGTGHRVVAWLKALLFLFWGRERVERLVKFLVFDTAQEAVVVNLHGQAVSLEPGSEFVDIGQTPVANIKRNLKHQAAIRERLGSVIANLPPKVLRNGAKQIRPLGLLAFLWRYSEVEERLREAIWSLAGRDSHEGRGGINVFIINSLVGGTGSSTFLDVAHLVRALFDELGSLADFCYITGVGLLSRAFQGINGRNMVPNMVASLKELNHCMMRGDFTARYPNGRIVTAVQPPFNIYYLVDGVDERGFTWRGPNEVYRLAAEAIFLQMGSQVGQKQENDFDNLDEVLVQQTEEGYGTFNSSFGEASLEFSGPDVARACAARQAVCLVDRALLAEPQPVDPLPADFIEEAGLQPAALADRLARDDQGSPLVVELPVPGWVGRMPVQAIPAELVRYTRDFERVRLGSDFKRWLEQNEEALAGTAAQALFDRLQRLAGQAGLPAAEAFLTAVLDWLETTAGGLGARQAEREGQIAGLSRELGHLETAFLQAGEGFFLGRAQRVARMQQTYFTAAQRLYSLRWQLQVTAAVLALLNHVARAARDHLAACQEATARLKAARRNLLDLGATFDRGPASGVTTQSLADEVLTAALFKQHAPPVTETQVALFSNGTSPLDWATASLDDIQAGLLAACLPQFEAVAALSVEDALALRGDEISPEGIYNQLIEQATPSWNLDRTRLPDGGAGLQRLVVLGVPDETTSIFRQHATMLVSTGDRTRLTALVAHIGAAHTALQQWDSYQAAYDRARGRTPLHVLPQFQADTERSRTAFALAWLFRFVTNQGAYFYYSPADRLDRPVKLAQGLANALQGFINQEELVQEAWERINQVVATQGVEATLRRLAAYYNAGNGSDRPAAEAARPGEELALELKRLVRAYADELRQIHQFTHDMWPPDGDGNDGSHER